MLESSRRGFIKTFSAAGLLAAAAGPRLFAAKDEPGPDLYTYDTDPRQLGIARMIIRYFEDMSQPVPFKMRTGKEFEARRTAADMPEVCTLGMPVSVQYLTMDDFTGNFRRNAFPAIKTLYERNGHPGRLRVINS